MSFRVRQQVRLIQGVKKMLSGSMGQNIAEAMRPWQIVPVDPAAQISLRLQYEDRVRRGEPLPRLNEVEFRVHSQNGEDGILLFLFAVLGTTNRKAVEMCVESGVECNVANLIIHHGWQGLLVDGSAEKLAVGAQFYHNHRNTFFSPPKLFPSWITRENVNSIFTQNGFDGDIDLFSLDIDGNDYWIWQAITVARPRVVVAEFNHLLGPERALTVPYKEDFVAEFNGSYPDYSGASLAALTRLANEKGYRLVGTSRIGLNAFFVRDDCGADLLPAVTPARCFADSLPSQFATPERIAAVLKKPWVEV